MEKIITGRGGALIEFTDLYGAKCSLLFCENLLRFCSNQRKIAHKNRFVSYGFDYSETSYLPYKGNRKTDQLFKINRK